MAIRHGGLTGNLGAGKSTVARLFSGLGIPVYDADLQARQFLSRPDVQQQLHRRYGDRVFTDNAVNTAVLAGLVFCDATELQWLNALIHPLVAADYMAWRKQQKAPYSLLDAALLFESGLNASMDFVIVVTAPQELRRQRLEQRSQLTAEQFEKRQQFQLPEAELIRKADYRIVNDGHQLLIPQVVQIHRQLCQQPELS